MLENDREQVFAPEARHHLLGLRRDRDRIRVVDHKRVHRRIVERRQRFADRAHVDRPRAGRNEVRPLERRLVDRIRAAGRQQQAAGRIAPRANQRRQARHVAHGHPAAGCPLHPVVRADRGRLDRSVIAREPLDHIGVDPADLRDALRRIFVDACDEALVPHRVTIDVIAIDEPIADQHVHQRERESAVGSGQQRDVLIAFLGRQALVGIDRDHLGAAALRLDDARPQMHGRRDRIRPPQQDQFRIDETLHVHADRPAERVRQSHLARRRADRALEQRCAQLVKEPAIHRRALHLPHRPGIAVRQDRLRILVGQQAQP